MRALALAIVGAALLAGAAQAQPYGGYTPWGGYAYRYRPPQAYGYDGRYTPYAYGNGYDGYNLDADPDVSAGVAIAPELVGAVPYDAYGANPDGMIGPDGRRIRCELRSRWDDDHGRIVVRRRCR